MRKNTIKVKRKIKRRSRKINKKIFEIYIEHRYREK